jgi:hypothetical protein
MKLHHVFLCDKTKRHEIHFKVREKVTGEGGVGDYFPLGFPLHPRPLKPRLPEPDPGR